MNFSFTQIKEALRGLMNRFPVTMGFSVVMLLNLYIGIDTAFEKGSATLITYSTYFLTWGIFISLFFELWEEEAPNKRLTRTLWCTAILLALADTIILANKFEGNPFTQFETESVILARASIFISLICGCFCISFLRNKDDIQLWNFSVKVFSSLSLACIVTGIMVGGVLILIFAFTLLFSFHFEPHWILRILLPFLVLLPISMTLLSVPRKDKHDDSNIMRKHISTMTRYLFLPLLICYLVVMYAYLIKILFTWELPRGTVAWMVTVMMAGMLALELLLYPILRSNTKTSNAKEETEVTTHRDAREENKFNIRMAKLLPWLMLPLLVLMTVGIARRVSDYGITTDRLYVILENIWYYVVCLYLISTQNRRILWIPLSFCLLFLLSSAQPFNFVYLPKYIRTRTVSKIMEKHVPAKLPMDKESFGQWIQGLSEEEKKSLIISLHHLQNSYSEDTLQWVNFTIKTGWHYQDRYGNERETYWDDDEYEKQYKEKEVKNIYYTLSNHDNLTIPQGYKTVQFVKGSFGFSFNDKSQAVCTVRNHTIAIDTTAMHRDNGEEMLIQTSDTNFIFIPTSMHLQQIDDFKEIDLYGYFFGK
ncbi:MAG: DUF4153 domain-containing protein [Paludibacteraceae bacterium]|nr:DUF4153 domain-containing protein [Paludibacteraceae bacterium]